MARTPRRRGGSGSESVASTAGPGISGSGSGGESLQAMAAASGIPAEWLPHVTFSRPTRIDYRIVSVEQLHLLSRGADDNSLNISLALGGISGGLLQNALDLVSAVKLNSVPASKDLILGLVCIGCAGYAIARYTEYRRNKPVHEEQKRRILEGSPSIEPQASDQRGQT